MEQNLRDTEVAIIGGGIVGAAMAHEFSRYKVDVCLIEKEPDFGFGITKGSQGLLHSSLGLLSSRIVKWFQSKLSFEDYMNEPMRLKEQFDLQGLKVFRELSTSLNVKLDHPGRIMLAQNEDEVKMLHVMKAAAEKNMGAKEIVFLDRKQVQEMEPSLDPNKFVAALFDNDEGVIFPYEWARAFAENAQANGVHTLLDTEVLQIHQKNDYWMIHTNQGIIQTKYVINAAGLCADEITNMIGKLDFSWIILKQQNLILENTIGIKHLVGGVHTPTVVRFLFPTTEGNIYVGAGMSMIKDKTDLSTDKETLEYMSTIPTHFFPDIKVNKSIITSYSALLQFNSKNPDDYIIESPVKGFINAIICAPGLAPSPIIAREVLKMIANQGLQLVKKSNIIENRTRSPRLIDLPTDEKNTKIKESPEYGHIVCRCEKVSEMEIIDAVKRGIITLDGIKLDTRAGLGRCQGGFCTSRVIKIIANESGLSPLKVRKKADDSYILKCKTKEILKKEI